MKMFYKSKGKNWIFLQFAPFGRNLFLFFSFNYEFEASIRSCYKSNIREPLSKDRYSPYEATLDSLFTFLCLRVFVWYFPKILSLTLPNLLSGQVYRKNNSHQSILQQKWQVGVVIVKGNEERSSVQNFYVSRWSILSELTFLSRSRKLKEWNINFNVLAYL